MSHPSDTPHSSHVESRSRKALRSYIIQASTLLEIVLSGLVLIGLLLSFIPLLKWMPGLLFDGNDVEIRGFLERALDIVIGVEFIKMLAKHSPGSSSRTSTPERSPTGRMWAARIRRSLPSSGGQTPAARPCSRSC